MGYFRLVEQSLGDSLFGWLICRVYGLKINGCAYPIVSVVTA
jgi:hypothetical protein